MNRAKRQLLFVRNRLVVLAIIIFSAALPVHADDPAAPVMPPAVEAWRSSPFHGAISGATGQPIPCLCRFRERKYHLGEMVCMQTPDGVRLVRCDLAQNNTSWVPTTEQCTISWHLPQSRKS